VYVLEPSVLDHVPAGQPSSFERNLFPSLLASGAPVYGEELYGYWRDLGTPIAYLAAQFDLLEGRLRLPINATERGRSQWFADDARIADDAVLRGPILVGQGATVESQGRVFGPSVLGPGAMVAGGARLERSVLLEDARIERGAKVSDSIIGRGVVVGDGAVVRDGAVVGDNVMIEAGNILAGGVRVAPNVRLDLGAIRF
jgi:NDP-sugar pyrophosphorylase family protein